ncbi:hypothetical protein HNP46_000001 [Pseudomonas nitritireducens]|uniref:Uncharacterized protein n=1 Tax=Pseudomonas nitroreducens TaxID=46680 RepID=A0A7W7KE55_PSENT|nr:hypothetical protein [Pseudomonas nitritireducens]MBB4861190.1 hypothetical protein [Pseudomonas nitritireducens]
MILIVSDKWYCSTQIASALVDVLAGEEVLYLAGLARFSLSPSYPRNLKYASFPILLEPEYAVRPTLDQDGPEAYMRLHRCVEGKTTSLPPCDRNAVSELLARAEKVILAPDQNIINAWAVWKLVTTLGGADIEEKLFIVEGLLFYPPELIRDRFANMFQSGSTGYERQISPGKIKRFFDYNFDINSSAVLGKLYQSVCGRHPQHNMSKYMLQALYWLQEQEWVETEDVDQRLQQWPGTGRHAPSEFWMLHGLGSVLSRRRMMTQLFEVGLVEIRRENPIVEHSLLGYTISEKGSAYLGRLHKDCRDPDLPYRLEAWMGLPEEEAKAKISSYLRRFFGQQKRKQKL